MSLRSVFKSSRPLFAFQKSLQTPKRKHSSSPTKSNVSIVFDIDGVLVKGKHVLEEGKKAMRYLNGENPLGIKVPYIFMTNSGGISEEEKANELTNALETQITQDQVVLSHSPMRQLVSQYKNKSVLVVGGIGNRCAEIAHSYGFDKVVTPQDIHRWSPAIWQFSEPSSKGFLKDGETIDFNTEKISAILMFHDTYNYGRDLQIVMDVLRSKDGALGNEFCLNNSQSVPLWVSNEDFLFSNERIHPRFAQGAFHVCLKALWEKSTGKELKVNVFGKPHKVQYEYAENLLHSWIQLHTIKNGSISENSNSAPHFPKIYAIGDNPNSDIAGANRHGWSSVLVRTGVFNGRKGENHHEHRATHVSDHVLDAVKILRIMSGRQGEQARLKELKDKAAKGGPLLTGGIKKSGKK
ncbi:hypothetical protein BB559_004175 [Furculomyces boomerangus]|uniref:TIGR01456 family HAD hydrolase n=2 Tax=Harpellales TaxID=61421 RepID=A0A2T9YG67_9FUNG|nr:hypothetical protein BB559_004175 [Furculomyces boomerangus]PVZ99728.1 hypothetical protein BB558_004237 [Smittium angustum]